MKTYSATEICGVIIAMLAVLNLDNSGLHSSKSLFSFSNFYELEEIDV